MNKILPALFFVFFSSHFFSQDSLHAKKILIVATNVDVLGKNENGTYLIEIAYPFQYFIDKGFEVNILTPKGGQTAIYPKEYAGPGLGKIQRSELFISKTKNSLSPSEINFEEYDAVYYPGGYGQFFDVVNNDQIASLTAKIYEKGGVLGTAGHGTASLINIKLSNNSYLVKGKNITCFPWSTEITAMFISDYGKLLPFNMEEVLKKRGAHLTVCSPEQKASKDCRNLLDENNRIVTGAYADDCLWVAEQISRLVVLNKK